MAQSIDCALSSGAACMSILGRVARQHRPFPRHERTSVRRFRGGAHAYARKAGRHRKLSVSRYFVSLESAHYP